jgi:hypothetical protein
MEEILLLEETDDLELYTKLELSKYLQLLGF